jgi:zinc protease
VGDVDADDVLRRAGTHFGDIARGPEPRRLRVTEPAQVGERRVIIEREGTVGYVKVVFHAPALTDPDFFPMLVLDAILTGAKGVNLWSSFRGTPPQRKARLYVKLVERGLASAVSGALLPTEQPFLYTLSLTAMEGTPLEIVEAATLDELERVRTAGVDAPEMSRAKRQLRARLVFENDSVTNIAHQLGFFETVAGPDIFPELQSRIDAVTSEQVWDVARRRLVATGRTVGWFRPVESGQ